MFYLPFGENIETRHIENIVVVSVPWVKNSGRTEAGHCPKTTCRNA